jgi:RNA polymerase sigma factor (TIGR02999 family)
VKWSISVDDTGTISQLLCDFDNGDASALDAVFPLVYDQLREIAHRHRRRWSGDSTLGTTALVNEAYLRLVDAKRMGARSRVHFMRVASRAMRQILSNYGRDQRALKRGGDAQVVSLESPDSAVRLHDDTSSSLSDLADALDGLEDWDPRLARVVECRFFGGLSIEETSNALGVSAATVKRDWLLARAWLFREMNGVTE